MDNRKMCVIIGAGLNITPDKSALFNADVGDGDRVMPVGSSVDALDALAGFARRVYLLTKTLISELSLLSTTKGLT